MFLHVPPTLATPFFSWRPTEEEKRWEEWRLEAALAQLPAVTPPAALQAAHAAGAEVPQEERGVAEVIRQQKLSLRIFLGQRQRRDEIYIDVLGTGMFPLNTQEDGHQYPKLKFAEEGCWGVSDLVDEI